MDREKIKRIVNDYFPEFPLRNEGLIKALLQAIEEDSKPYKCSECGQMITENSDHLDGYTCKPIHPKPKEEWKKGECKNCQWQGMYCVVGDCNYTPKEKSPNYSLIEHFKNTTMEQWAINEVKRLDNIDYTEDLKREKSLKPQPNAEIEEWADKRTIGELRKKDALTMYVFNLTEKINELVRWVNGR